MWTSRGYNDPMRRVSRRPPLARLYDELNATFWDGSLPAAIEPRRIGLTAARHVRLRRVGFSLRMRYGLGGQPLAHGVCLGLFVPPGLYVPAVIRLLSPLSADLERQVLLHEMCHWAVYVAGHHDEVGHGPQFLAELERLGGRGETWVTEQIARYHADPEDVVCDVARAAYDESFTEH